MLKTGHLGGKLRMAWVMERGEATDFADFADGDGGRRWVKAEMLKTGHLGGELRMAWGMEREEATDYADCADGGDDG